MPKVRGLFSPTCATGETMNQRQFFLSPIKAALATAFGLPLLQKEASAPPPTAVAFPDSTVLPLQPRPFTGVIEPNLIIRGSM